MRLKNSGPLIGAVLLTLPLVLAGCGEASEPQLISDQERARLTTAVETASWIEDAVCTVEVFRQEGTVTYGWAECSNALSEEPNRIEQAESSPFRIEGNSVQVPDNGSEYQEDIRRLFPEDLISTIEQYSGFHSAAATNH